MSLTSKLKKRRGIIFSILLHLLLLIGAFHTFDQDRALPTSTIGYQVDLVHTEDVAPPPSPATPAVKPQVANSNPIAAVASTLDSKADVNLKAQDAKKKTLTPEQLEQQRLAEAKAKAQQQALRKQRTEARQAREEARAMQRQIERQAQQAKQPTQVNKTPTQEGVTMTNKNQAQIAASAPTGAPNQVGDGGETNSSTDGDGTQASAFDFRVIEYGRDAAYAINQNIVIPPAYQNTHVTYRAFVVLDRNMQFQSMHMVKSTGIPEFDTNIAKALRETVYPPLPNGANWHEFHNIDFTIK